MPLNLHPNAKAATISALAEGLPHVRVTNGTFLEAFTAFLASYQANEALPKTGNLHDKLVEYVDDLPLVEFVTEHLRREISENIELEYSPDMEATPLTSLVGYEDTTNSAHRIIEVFETLPWSLTFTLQLSEKLFPDEMLQDGPLRLGSSGQIAKPDLLFSEQYPLSHPNANRNNRARGPGALGLLMIGSTSWKESQPCYQYNDQGFVGMYGGGNVVDRAERAFESFFGLGLATRLFTYAYRYENEKANVDWIVHIGDDQQKEFYSRFSLDEDIAGVLRHVFMFRFEQSYPEENRIPWLRGAMDRANKVFLSANSKTLLLSAKWFFDSFKGRDDTLKYIRMMTSLEILLGERADTSKASLGEILANRLAYLIGKNHDERANILVDFKQVYGVRSGILHHGKHRLRGEERSLIAKLRKFCERAIEEEARLILA